MRLLACLLLQLFGGVIDEDEGSEVWAEFNHFCVKERRANVLSRNLKTSHEAEYRIRLCFEDCYSNSFRIYASSRRF